MHNIRLANYSSKNERVIDLENFHYKFKLSIIWV